jgi:hypothetical protein
MSFVRSLINGGGSNITTPDLLKDTSKPITDTDYFDIVITDLQPNTSYNVQFSWVYPDDTRSEYSSTYNFTTSLESAPEIPSQPTVTVGPGLINVTWNGNKAGGGALQNYAKVNIYVNGVLRDFLLASGTKSIPLAKGTYSITLRSASSTNVVSDATSPAVSATVTTDATDAASAQSDANLALLELQNKLTKTANMLIVSDNLTAINSNGITLFTTGVENGSATSVPSAGKRVVMNYKGIRAYNSNSTSDLTGVTFAIDATAGNAFFSGEIAASMVTGSTIRTAEGSTLRRAIFDPSTHALSFYATGGAGQSHISPLNDANNPGVIISAGSTPLSSILLSTDPSILIYKIQNSSGQITLSSGAGTFLSISTNQAQWVGTVPTPDSGQGGGGLRNIDTVTTTNWGNGSQYTNIGTDGQVMLVYTP